MKNTKLLRETLMFLVSICLAMPATAQTYDDWSFFGGFQVGYRSVNVDGSEDKYRQHLNLEDGPRLFNLNFELTPTGEMRGLFDRVELDMTNLGGDPFETLRFSIQKFGRFSLKYDRLKSTYFYDDIILPVPLSDPALSNAGDLHAFNFDRVHDRVNFNLSLSHAAQLDFGFDRFSKKGHSTTTIDIERDEFELDKPIDETMSDYSVAFQYSWPRVTLVLEGRVRDYENAVEMFLPGFSEGENPENATELGYYFLDNPYDLRAVIPSLKLVARPTDRFNIKFYAAVEDLTMDIEAHEEALGTTWQGEPYESSASGEGGIDRKSYLYDLDLDYRFFDWFAVVLGARQRDLDQSGEMVFDETDGTGDWTMNTTSLHLGLQFDIGTRFSVTGGVRSESRDVESDWSHADNGAEETKQTDHTGYFMTLGWRPTKELRVSARVDDSSYDNPFTLTSPSSKLSYRIAAQWSRPTGFSVSGVIRGLEVDNDLSGWNVQSKTANLRLGYRLPGLSLSAGYTFIDVERQIDQTVTTLPGFGGGEELFFPIFYRADSDFIDARIVWAAATRLKIGGQARWYDNAGSFAVATQDLRAFVEFGFGKGYVAHLGYRDVDYDEVDYNWDDYRAKITELSVGYRW